MSNFAVLATWANHLKQPTDPPAGRAVKSQLSVLITGDVSFGEPYQIREEGRGNENILKTRGYAHALEKLSGLLLNSDLVLGNFESAIAGDLVSPFTAKRFLNWSDSRETPEQLRTHNIRTVSLANNHTMDFGEAGLLQTIEVLQRAGIQVIGAGKNLAEARKPFDYEIDLRSAAGSAKRQKIKAFAAFVVDDKYRQEFKAYAEKAKPGTNPLQVEDLAQEIAAVRRDEPDTFIIALLHWRRDYQWRSKAQLAATRAIMEAGADVVMGHGAHMLQEIEKVANHWVCHGLGNFAYNSPGFYDSKKAPPFSLVCRLIFSSDSSSPRCLLYPLLTNNRVTRYQTRFVNDAEFNEVVRLLQEKTNDRAGFDREIGTGRDEFGHFIEMPLQTGHRRIQRPAPAQAERQVLQGSAFELFTRTYKGANIHVPQPAVRCEVGINDADVLKPKRRDRTVRRLLRLLPELDGMLPVQANDVTWVNKALLSKVQLAEIAAVVAYTLMRRVDEFISPVDSGPLNDEAGFYLLCEYKRSPNNAKAAVKLAIELLDPANDRKALKRSLDEFESKGRRRAKVPFHAANVMEAAEARGIPVFRSVAGPPILGMGSLQMRLQQTMTTKSGYLAVKIAHDKVQTANVLRQAGLPAPKQERVTNERDAIAAAANIGYPVVVKPASGNMGRGVSVRLTSEAQIARAFREAAAVDKTVIVESFIPGASYRLLVVDGEMVAASKYIAGHVTGNGTDTIKRLLEDLNADPLRDNHFLYKIKLDFDARRMLEEQGLTLESIPENGKVVFLRSNSNPNVGALCIGLTEQVHPDNRLLAIAATRALQLDVAGIDMITEDISRSYKETKGAICEVNNMPGLGAHATPTSGTVVEVAPYILDMLFPPPSTGRVPIIAVCGDDFNDRLSHSIAHMLQMAGYEVGLATHAGFWVGGDKISSENSANFDGSRRALLHPSVSAAVIEVTTGSLLSEGLGFDFADVALITSSFSGLLGDQEQSKGVAALIRSVAGSLVFADDASATKGLWAATGQNKLYLTNSVPVDFSSQAQIVRVKKNGGSIVTLETSKNGGTVAFQANGNSPKVDLAIAACHAIDVSPHAIEDALRAHFDASLSDPLLLSRLATPFGEALLATPRTDREVDAICNIARSWTAPQSPDIVIHMAFEGDSDLRAALDKQLQRGSARALGLDRIGHAEADLPSLVFKDKDRRVVILTDNMEFFKKRLRPVGRTHS